MKSKLLISIFVMVFLAAAVDAFVISGKVTDTNLNPINDSQINVYNAATTTLINSTTTNASGDYSLDVGTSPMLMVVNASKTGFDTQGVSIFVNSDKTINFALGPIQAVALSGYVKDNSSNPLNNVDITVKQGSATFTQTTTNMAGFYTVDLVNGTSYNVTASLTGYDLVTSPVTMDGNKELNFTLIQTSVSCTENWTCTAWSSCSGGTQTRTCTDLNNCGTTVNKPAESQSCSSGGGGGSRSSSYTGTGYEVDIAPDTIVTKELRRNDYINFDFENNRHKVTLIAVYSKSVSIKVESTPVIATLNLLEKKGFNLNDDLANDLFITLESISGEIAKLRFELAEPLTLPELPISVTPKYINTSEQKQPHNPIKIIVENEEITVEEEGNKESSSKIISTLVHIKGALKDMLNKILYLKYILAGIVILAVLILIISAVSRIKSIKTAAARRSRKKEEIVNKIKELESQLKELKQSV